MHAGKTLSEKLTQEIKEADKVEPVADASAPPNLFDLAGIGKTPEVIITPPPVVEQPKLQEQAQAQAQQPSPEKKSGL